MTLRELEAQSIRSFVQSAADEGYLSGRVLDYGCGKQPYREIVEAGGEYHGYDRAWFGGALADVGDVMEGEHDTWWFREWDSILCTQVLQYVPMEEESPFKMPWLLRNMARKIRGGHLVLTYPTNWPEVEPDDLHRFTKAGMERLLGEAGFEIVKHEPRETAAVTLDGEELIAGYGVIARA